MQHQIESCHAGTSDSQELFDRDIQRSTSLDNQTRKDLDDGMTLTNTSIISRYERGAPEDDGRLIHYARQPFHVWTRIHQITMAVPTVILTYGG